jgi:hypothetical protein
MHPLEELPQIISDPYKPPPSNKPEERTMGSISVTGITVSVIPCWVNLRLFLVGRRIGFE